jgi:hypothetical protein
VGTLLFISLWGNLLTKDWEPPAYEFVVAVVEIVVVALQKQFKTEDKERNYYHYILRLWKQFLEIHFLFL